MEQNYAGFGRRFLAYIVDAAVLSLIGFGLGFSFSLMLGRNASLALLVPSIILGAGYFIFFWIKDGQTLGHRVMALKVIREDGKPIDFATAFIRYIGFLVSGAVIYLGFIWIIFDSKKQGWADKMAKTVVVKTGEKPKTWIPIVLLILWFFTIMFLLFLLTVGLFAAGAILKNNPKLSSQFQNKYGTTTSNSMMGKNPPSMMETNYVNSLITALPGEINKYRGLKNLKPLATDPQLCAYAQKRADYLAQLGKADDGQQFYEDLANPNMARAYFNKFKTAGSAIVEVSNNVPTTEQVVNYWVGADPKTSVMTNPVYTYGCVRGNDSFVVLIAGESN